MLASKETAGMTALANATAPVRRGEELDAARIAGYLHATFGLESEVLVEQFPSGHSNLTYLVRAGRREFVLRRPPFGTTVKSAHDMGREFRVLTGLEKIYPLAPRPLAYCEDASVLGAPFYLMTRLDGIILRKSLPPGVTIPEETARRFCRAFIDNLAAIHSLDLGATGLRALGKPEGYVQRQVEGWTKRYHDARTEDVPGMARLAGWLSANRPPESGAALIHNDYKPDNIVLDPADLGRILGVLDWEMATVGDPLMDLGCTLAYWVEGDDTAEMQALKFAPTTCPGFFRRRELAELYRVRTGREPGDIVFYYAFGLFKLAVIIQQIYFRYAKGLTRDERFAGFGEAVKVLARRAAEAVETGRV